MSDDKTENATPHKLQKAREEGQVFKSEDLAQCAALASATLGLYMAERLLTDSLDELMTSALNFIHAAHDQAMLLSTLRSIGVCGLRAALPFVALGMLGSLLARAMQVGFTVSFKPVEPKIENVNPATGLKRVFSLQSLATVALMALKGLVVATVIWIVIRRVFPLVAGALYQPLRPLARVLWQTILELVAAAIVVFFVIGMLDYLVQRAIFLHKQRMSKDEVKRERKDMEGDPMLKDERKRIGREMATTDAPKSLAAANMLVVNPTHYAVAVRYALDECPLPVVIAKGVDAQAARLRREADAAGVPIVANPPVARLLYNVPTNEPIPDELFEVVAAILRWVESIADKRRHS